MLSWVREKIQNWTACVLSLALSLIRMVILRKEFNLFNVEGFFNCKMGIKEGQ